MIENKLFQNVKKNPQKIIFIYGKKKITYSEFFNRVIYFSDYLKKKVKKNSKILLLQKNSIEWAVYYFSIRFANLTPIIASDLSPNHKILSIIKENEIKYIISEKKIKIKNIIFIKDINKKNKNNNIFNFKKKITGNEIIYTSGSTGKPKGVILKLETSLNVAKMINSVVRVKKNSVELLSVPFFHSDGLGRLKCLILNGHTMVINDTPNNFVRFFYLLEKYKINGFFMVSSGIEILKKLNFLDFKRISSNIKFIEIGSENIKTKTLLWVQKTFKKAKIYFHYGLTEASRSAFKVIDSSKSIPKSFKINKGVTFDIIKDGKKCKKNELGEIFIRGKNVSLGYINNEENFRFTKNGFKTGDYGKKITNNSFKLKGRIDNVKKINGQSVSLEEIERAIVRFPMIDECTCSFIIDANSGGYKIHARYKSKISINKDKLTNFLRKRLELFKIPNNLSRTR